MSGPKHVITGFAGTSAFIGCNVHTPSGSGCCPIKLMKGRGLRKHNLHEQIAASVLLKLFINGNERCHTTDAP